MSGQFMRISAGLMLAVLSAVALAAGGDFRRVDYACMLGEFRLARRLEDSGGERRVIASRLDAGAERTGRELPLDTGDHDVRIGQRNVGVVGEAGGNLASGFRQ